MSVDLSAAEAKYDSHASGEDASTCCSGRQPVLPVLPGAVGVADVFL